MVFFSFVNNSLFLNFQLFEDTINIILTFVMLFSPDFCALQEYERVVQIQVILVIVNFCAAGVRESSANSHWALSKDSMITGETVFGNTVMLDPDPHRLPNSVRKAPIRIRILI